MERIPPHNIEAEQAILSAVLDLRGLPLDLELLPEWFYRAAHRTIFTTMIEMDAKGQEIDLVTLTDALKSKKKLQ